MEPARIRSSQAVLWDLDRKICAVFSSIWVHSFIHNILLEEKYECILRTERSNLVCSQHTCRMSAVWVGGSLWGVFWLVLFICLGLIWIRFRFRLDQLHVLIWSGLSDSFNSVLSLLIMCKPLHRFVSKFPAIVPIFFFPLTYLFCQFSKSIMIINILYLYMAFSI